MESEVVREDTPDHFRIVVGGTCQVTKSEISGGAEGPVIPG